MYRRTGVPSFVRFPPSDWKDVVVLGLTDTLKCDFTQSILNTCCATGTDIFGLTLHLFRALILHLFFRYPHQFPVNCEHGASAASRATTIAQVWIKPALVNASLSAHQITSTQFATRAILQIRPAIHGSAHILGEHAFHRIVNLSHVRGGATAKCCVWIVPCETESTGERLQEAEGSNQCERESHVSGSRGFEGSICL
jgi:hypothetical protein